MRRILPVIVPAISATLFLFANACQDDSTDGGFVLPEAGGFDVVAPKFDGSIPDGGIDSPGDIFVPPLPVTVHVTNKLGAESGISVVFSDANGAILETKTTDASGNATSAAYPAATPAMATVVFAPANGNRSILTWTAVEAGDVLPVVDPGGDSFLAEYDVTLGSQIDAGAGGPNTYYANVGDCQLFSWDGNGTGIVNIYTSCYRGGDALLVTANDSTDTIVAYARKKGLVLPTDGGVVPVTTDAFVAATNLSVSVSNPPASVVGSVRLDQVVGSTTFLAVNNGLPDTGPFTYAVAPSSVADAYAVAVSFPAGMYGRRIAGKRVAPTASISFDGNTDLPPAITNATYDLTTTPLRPSVTYEGTLTGMKGGVVRFRYFDQFENSTDWSIVVPFSAMASTTVKAPQLPATFETILPQADGGGSGWNNFSGPEIAFADSNLLPDYATFKKIQGAVLPAASSGSVTDIVLPQNGTYKITRWQEIPQ